jgi:hypothetical protein
VSSVSVATAYEYLPARLVARVTPVRNSKALTALLLALCAVAIIVAGGVRTNSETAIDLLVIASVPASFVVALIALSLARRARFDYQKTLGHRGGRGIAWLARALGVLALLLSFTGGLAIAVFSILKLVA